MAAIVKIGITADPGSAISDLGKVESAAKGAATKIDSVGSSAKTHAKSMDGFGEAADSTATKTSTLAGAMGDVGGGLAAIGLAGATPVLTGIGTAMMFAAGISDILAVATEVQALSWIKNTAAMVGSKIATGASVVATGAMTAAQWALNVAMSANPIALILIGLLALGVLFVVLWKKSQTFRDIVTGTWNAIKTAAVTVFNWAKTNWPLILAILTGPVGLAVLFITKHFDGIVTFVTGLPAKMLAAGKGIWDFLTGSFKTAVNTVLGFWNNLHIPSIHIGFDTHIPGVGEIGFDTPNINFPDVPLLSGGGRISSTGLAVVHAGETVLPAGAGGNNFYTINVNVDATADQLSVGRAVVKAIEAVERVSHRRLLVS